MDRAVGFARYDLYKSTGDKWLSKIPYEWEFLRTKSIFQLVAEPAPKNNSEELLSVYTDIGVKPRKELEERGNKASTTDGYWFVKKGDIVVNKLLAWMGAIGMSDYNGVTSPAYDILRPRQPLNPKFYHYLFRSEFCISKLKQHSKGIMDMRLRLYFDEFGRIHIPFPPLDIQNRIVTFLDQKTAEIDEAIAKKQRLIELLKEQKAILINQAVTKGLNRDVPMRDSGVEWIGEVPGHWVTKRLKHLFTEVNARTKTGKEELLSLRMYTGLVAHNDVSDKPITDDELIDYKLIEPGQMVMNRMRASIGLFGFATTRGLVSPDYAVFNVDDEINTNYFLALFKTVVMGQIFRLHSRGLGTGSSGFMRLYTDSFGSISVPFPPEEEQVAIGDHIHTINDFHQQAEAKINREIELLEEDEGNDCLRGRHRKSQNIRK